MGGLRVGLRGHAVCPLSRAFKQQGNAVPLPLLLLSDVGSQLLLLLLLDR